MKRKPWYAKRPRRHVHVFVETWNNEGAEPYGPGPGLKRIYVCECGELGYPVPAKS